MPPFFMRTWRRPRPCTAAGVAKGLSGGQNRQTGVPIAFVQYCRNAEYQNNILYLLDLFLKRAVPCTCAVIPRFSILSSLQYCNKCRDSFYDFFVNHVK